MANQIEARDYTQGSKKAALDAGAINDSLAPFNKLFQAILQNKYEQQLLAQRGEQEQGLEKLKSLLQGEEQKQSIDRLGQMMENAPEGAGGAVTPGGASFTRGYNPMTLQNQSSHQAQAFIKQASGAYKPINDQLDASKATIDNLNLGNSTGDKLALLNEARLALAGSGGRAFGMVLSQLSGDPTMAQDAQKGINWLQNTPNVPTMQPAQRDAIREGAFGRLNQLRQQHQQIKQQLTQQAPIVAPQADSTTLLNSMISPVDQKLDQLGKMQKEYQDKRAKQEGAPVSNPDVATPNPTTLDKVKSFFSGMLAPPTQAPADPIAEELARRAKQAQQQGPQQPLSQ